MACNFIKAFEWAQARGDSSGANKMRKLLLSLYNPDRFAYSAGEALYGLDEQGMKLAVQCMVDYWSVGETEGLRIVGDQIIKDGHHSGFIELCRVAFEAQCELRNEWRREEARVTEDE